MARKIEYLNVRPTDNLVHPASRYAGSNVISMEVDGQNYTTFSIYRRAPLAETPQDRVSIIPPRYEYRPDLASRDAYGSDLFWAQILEANNMKDVFEFKAGLTIRIPNAIFR